MTHIIFSEGHIVAKPCYWHYRQSEAALQRVLRKSCSEIMQQIYRRTQMPKCDFNKVALHFNMSAFL